MKLNGQEKEFEHKYMQYRSTHKGGAYIFAPQGEASLISPQHSTVTVIKVFKNLGFFSAVKLCVTRVKLNIHIVRNNPDRVSNDTCQMCHLIQKPPNVNTNSIINYVCIHRDQLLNQHWFGWRKTSNTVSISINLVTRKITWKLSTLSICSHKIPNLSCGMSWK